MFDSIERATFHFISFERLFLKSEVSISHIGHWISTTVFSKFFSRKND